MISEVQHTETWHTIITREPKCICDFCKKWPDELQVGGWSRTVKIRPDKIIFTIRGGEEDPDMIKIHGYVTSPGSDRRLASRYRLDSAPEWALEVIEHERQSLGIGPERTAR